jgi:hypothetical protein
MLSKSSSRTFDDIGNRDADPGTEAWIKFYTIKARQTRESRDADVADLNRLLDSLKAYKAHEVFRYPSFGMYAQLEIGLENDDLDRLANAKDGQRIDAVLGPHGGDRKSEKARENQGSNRTLNRGTIAEYLTARLARDRPDILERMKAGEFPSVRAAAREAGIVRPTATIYTDNVDDALRAMLRHFSREEIIRAIDRG